MAPAIPILMLVGTAVSAVGAVGAAVSQNNAAKYNAQVAEQNAVYSRQSAAVEEQRQRMMARKQDGLARANYGASGLQVDASAEDVLFDSAANAELDSLLIRQGGENQARGMQNTANLQRYQGKAAMQAGALSAAGTLISGTAQAGYMQGQIGKAK